MNGFNAQYIYSEFVRFGGKYSTYYWPYYNDLKHLVKQFGIDFKPIYLAELARYEKFVNGFDAITEQTKKELIEKARANKNRTFENRFKDGIVRAIFNHMMRNGMELK